MWRRVVLSVVDAKIFEDIVSLRYKNVQQPAGEGSIFVWNVGTPLPKYVWFYPRERNLNPEPLESQNSSIKKVSAPINGWFAPPGTIHCPDAKLATAAEMISVDTNNYELSTRYQYL
jgi:hypothetical protein